MTLTEETTFEGRKLTVTWRDASFAAPRELITQVSGVCFTSDGAVVLVSADGETWQLVGGHPETAESLEAAFAREVREEACATVTQLAYLGAQEVNDPQSPTGPTTYYQARYWARVSLDEFRGRHEMKARTYVEPSAVMAALKWRTTRILEAIMQAALDHESRFSATE